MAEVSDAENHDTRESTGANTPVAPAAVREPGTGRWVKGHSPNPGGRKPMPAEVREILDASTPNAARRLCAIALDDAHPSQLRAIELVLDRGLGKVAQAVEVSTPDGSVARAALELAQLRATPSTSAALLVLAEAQAAMADRVD